VSGTGAESDEEGGPQLQSRHSSRAAVLKKGKWDIKELQNHARPQRMGIKGPKTNAKMADAPVS